MDINFNINGSMSKIVCKYVMKDTQNTNITLVPDVNNPILPEHLLTKNPRTTA